MFFFFGRHLSLFFPGKVGYDLSSICLLLLNLVFLVKGTEFGYLPSPSKVIICVCFTQLACGKLVVVYARSFQ